MHKVHVVRVVHTNKSLVWLGLCCLITPGLSNIRTFGVMYDNMFHKLPNHQIRHQATYKVDCQPGDCIWPHRSIG